MTIAFQKFKRALGIVKVLLDGTNTGLQGLVTSEKTHQPVTLAFIPDKKLGEESLFFLRSHGLLQQQDG